MEKLQFDYSYKNIPTPSQHSYRLQLIEKVEMVIKRMRWRAHFLEQPNDEPIPETYGLKTLNCPPLIKDLVPFENDLFDLVKSVKFRDHQNRFQRTLKNDIRTIKNTTTTLTFADKTSNLYKLSKDEHDTLLNNAVTSTYKKVNKNVHRKINSAGKSIVKDMKIFDRMLINGENEAFITLKDHKENFQNNPKVRLLNPAKNEIGRIAKSILDRVNNDLKAHLNINQWKNTDEVIEWFEAIPDKRKQKFIVFDIKDFYPSITKKLLSDAIKFAKSITHLSTKDVRIINHARKSLCFSDDSAWMKRNGNLFDVTMGAFDGAEVCELVGTYLQHKLSETYDIKNFGLYRDDGLSVFKNVSGSQSERIKKDLKSKFREYGDGLEIVIECNKKIVNYLDITLNLNDGTYRPYSKPDNKLQYINTQSNHPPNVIKQIPRTIEQRLSNHSSNERIFDQAKQPYEKALKESGYNTKLTYQPTKASNNRTKNRKRKITWFNPPFNQNVETKIARKFLQLIDKHFPKHHRLNKIFNRNTVKVSYSCTKNMKSIIQSHNKNILKQNVDENANDPMCNCRVIANCPLNGSCQVERSIYQATVTCEDEPEYGEKFYIGLAEPKFKKRYANHKTSFANERYEKETELSKEVWRLKRKNRSPTITWKTIRRCPPFNRSSLRCTLCLTEKLEIASFPDPGKLLNSRNELISKCRHVNKFTLKNHDTKD